MPSRLPNSTYRVQIRIKGHPPVDRVFDSKRQATEFERAERQRIKSKAPLYSLEMTFREAWHAYHGSMLFRSKKTTTQRTEESRIERALKGLGDYSLSQLLDGQVIARFRDQLSTQRVNVLVRPSQQARSSRGKAGKSQVCAKTGSGLIPGRRRDGNADGTLSNDAQRLVMAAVSSVMLWAVENNLIVRNPVRGIKKPQPRQRERRMERYEELQVFLKAKSIKTADERLSEDARFVAIQRELGCRPGELDRLLRADIDLESRAVRFRDTKNGERRIVHIVSEAVELLGSQLVQAELRHPNSPFLFTSLSRSGSSPVAFNHSSAVKRLRAARIVDPDFHAHAARREFASGAFEAGLQIEDIRKITGHRSVKALEAYNQSESLHPDVRQRVEDAGRRRAAERLDDLADALQVSPGRLRTFLAEAASRSSMQDDFRPAATAARPKR